MLRAEAQQLSEGDGNGGVDVGVDLETLVFCVYFEQLQSLRAHGTLKPQHSPLGLVLQTKRSVEMLERVKL